jgi:predicted ester cyclase
MPQDQATDSRQIVRRFVEELWGTGRKELVGDLVHANFIRHHERNPDADVHGIDGFSAWLMRTRDALPDLRLTIRQLFGEGDRVMVHLEANGTWHGDAEHPAPAATPLSFTVTGFVRVADGKVAEVWMIADTLGILQQLGAVPRIG